MDKPNAKLCDLITKKMKINEEFSQDECEIIYYMLYMLISETEKLIFLFCLFSIVGVRVPFMLSAAAIILTHPYTGGMHRETFWGCLFQSTVFFAGIIFLGNFITLPLFTVPVIYIITVVIYLRYVPTTSEKRGKYGEKSRKRIRKIALIGLSLVSILSSIFVKCRPYFMWVIMLEDIELLIINLWKGGMKHEKNK